MPKKNNNKEEILAAAYLRVHGHPLPENGMPFDDTNSIYHDCKNVNKDESIFIDGNALTAEYIWSKQGNDRIDLVHKVLDYYRKRGFPVAQLTDQELSEGFKSLKKCKATIENGSVKNSAHTGLEIAKHFTGKLFLQAKGHSKSCSCWEVFHDDALFLKVLKNRMGWVLSDEEREREPYLFNITDKMVFQGMRSSGVAYAASNFKPAVAKALYEKYNVKRTFDPSAGWGARAIAALSLGIEYCATDPFTHEPVNKLISYFKGKGHCSGHGSEENEAYAGAGKVDFVFTSPPYFDLETYGSDDNQSVVKFNSYNTWLEGFWKKTVENCLTILEDGGKFAFAMVDIVDKRPIAADMLKICEELGLQIVDKIDMITPKGHLSGKAKSGVVSKPTDRIYVLERK
jgi:hypothetical protein